MKLSALQSDPDYHPIAGYVRMVMLDRKKVANVIRFDDQAGHLDRLVIDPSAATPSPPTPRVYACKPSACAAPSPSPGTSRPTIYGPAGWPARRPIRPKNPPLTLKTGRRNP